MNQKIIWGLLLVVLIIGIVGCSAPQKEGTNTLDKTNLENVENEDIHEQELSESTDTQVSEGIEEDTDLATTLEEVEDITTDLDFSDLDGLDTELAELEDLF